MILAMVARTTAGAPARFTWLLVAGLAAIVAMAVAAAASPGVHRPARRRPVSRPTVAASVGLPPTMPPARTGQRAGVTPEYRDYIKGRIRGRDGIYWPERNRPWKAAFRRRRGRCEIGRVLARGGQPNCGPAPVTGPIHADHTDSGYRRLFAEHREDVALGCASCHATRERLKRQGILIYNEWGDP